MKKHLLPETGTYYKANLHCHSNLSDGALTPAEIKRIYKEKGYSIIAYTDHDIMIPHPELRDEDFLPLTGFETETNTDSEWRYAMTCHVCYIALEEDNVTMPFWHREKHTQIGNALKHRGEVRVRADEPYFERSYDLENINKMIRLARDRGFFVTYNHPTWSMEDYSAYTKYQGMHAMEIVNGGCIAFGFDDYNGREYDDMLRTGHKIFCIATDDNHNREPADSPLFDSFWGFTMIKADRLEYREITKALEAGNFYASQGPEIHELYLEDGVVHIKTGPAKSICCTKGLRLSEAVRAKAGEFVTEAAFPVKADEGYIRITVTDAEGRRADTNAYFMEDIL